MKLTPTFSFLKRKPALRQVVSENWNQRFLILEPNINLFCWRRPFNENISCYLKDLLQREIKPIKQSVNLKELDHQIIEKRNLWDIEDSPVADAFWQDVTQLVRDFLSFSRSGSGTMHLRVVLDNACTKFHTDGYDLRLFSTYYGKGTEWLPESATNRRELGKINGNVVTDQSEIRKMKAFEVGILKGEKPDRNVPTKGIVHRSPQVQCWDEKRIILRVDI